MKFIFGFILILYLWGCQKESPTQANQKSTKLGESFELKAGEAIVITGAPVGFRFDSVLYDGRCPEGVECFWAGYAAIVLSFADEKDTMNTIDRYKVSKGDYIVTLQKLSPYPKVRQQIPKDSYVAQFNVSKN